ncbi:MAG: hypothetical protein ABI333_13675 [bacterium]
MRTAILCTLIVALSAGLWACKKKPQSPKQDGDDKPGMTTGKTDTPRKAPVIGMAPATAAAACTKNAVTPGNPFKKEQFEVSVTAPAAAAVGSAAQAEVVVVPKAGHKYNLKYDTELVLKKLSEGVDVERKTYENKHAAERTKDRLRIAVKYTPKAAGKKVLQGVLDFSVCTPKLCVTEEACVAWETTAK